MQLGLDADQTPPLLQARKLPGMDRWIAPLIWRMGSGALGAEGPATMAAALGAGGWFYIPAAFPTADIEHLANAGWGERHVVVGLNHADLAARDQNTLRRRIALACDGVAEAVLLEDADPSQLKAGRPYHRLTQLRDTGLTRLIFLQAVDVSTGEWLIENTAAPAITVPFGLGDLTAQYDLTRIAAEMGTGLLARRPDRILWNPSMPLTEEQDLRFRLSAPSVLAAIEPLPTTLSEIQSLLTAMATILPEADRAAWWGDFQQQVPRPAKSPGRHLPEEGA